MDKVTIGHRRGDLVYVPIECKLRLLVTADFFETGGWLSSEAEGNEFANTVHDAVVRALRPIVEGNAETLPVMRGELRIGTIRVGPMEPALP